MKSGDTCPSCKKAYLGATSSRAAGEFQIRYLKCPKCGLTHRSVVRGETIRRRNFCPK
jgi:hypothetical protein